MHIGPGNLNWKKRNLFGDIVPKHTITVITTRVFDLGNSIIVKRNEIVFSPGYLAWESIIHQILTLVVLLKYGRHRYCVLLS